MRKPVARWKMDPAETGLRAVGAGPRGHTLRLNGEELMRVCPAGGNWARPLEGWYWVSHLGGTTRNTYGEGKIWPTAEEAKADATAFYKKTVKVTD